MSINKKITKFDVLNILLLSIWGLIIFYPFYNSFLISVISESEYIRTPFMIFPKNINFNSYLYIFASKRIWHGYRVTLIITVAGVLYNMMLTILTAFALSKTKFVGKNLVLNMIIFTMFFGGGLIPYYFLIRNLNLINSIFSMILPYGVNTFYMLIIRNFFKSIPSSLEESAKIDGANEFKILFKIILPLSMPALATISLFYAVDRWNEWFNGMLFIRDLNSQPLQLVLRGILSTVNSADARGLPVAITQNLYNDGVKMAAIFVTMAPVMCIYPFLQKYFMKGVMLGAIKS